MRYGHFFSAKLTKYLIFRCLERLWHQLTAFLWTSVVANKNLLVCSTEQSCPIDGVVVAKLAVLCNVDIPSTDLSQRLKLK